MAAIDDARVMGRARLSFADEHDIDEFVDKLGKFERGELSPEDWRRFRLLRGTYGQRQDGVQMLRIKIPQGIVNGPQMRALADVRAARRRAAVASPAPEAGVVLVLDIPLPPYPAGALRRVSSYSGAACISMARPMPARTEPRAKSAMTMTSM